MAVKDYAELLLKSILRLYKANPCKYWEDCVKEGDIVECKINHVYLLAEVERYNGEDSCNITIKWEYNVNADDFTLELTTWPVEMVGGFASTKNLNKLNDNLEYQIFKSSNMK